MYQHKSGIELRKLERADLPLLLELKKESWWGTHQVSILNADDQVRWYESLKDLVLIGCAQGQPVSVGIISQIDWISQSASISGSVCLNHRSGDIATRAAIANVDFAFEMLNLRRLNAEVLEYHIAAQKIEIGTLGFRVEALRREAVYKAGQFYNSIILGLLRDEWLQQPRVVGYDGSCNLQINHDAYKKLIERFNPAKILG